MEYDLVVYPFKVVIAIGAETGDLSKTYMPSWNDETEPFTLGDGFDAYTCYVTNKDTNEAGVLMYIKDSKSCVSSTLAHESAHAAMFVFKAVGAEPDLDNQEPLCYLIGAIMKMAVNTLYSPPNVTTSKIDKQTKKTNKRKHGKEIS